MLNSIKVELFEIELFDHLTLSINVWCLIELLVNLELFNFVDLCLQIIYISNIYE